MSDQLEIWIGHQMDDVHFRACEIVIQTGYFVSEVEEFFTKMRSDKAGTTCY
jgi:hypothetical protein